MALGFVGIGEFTPYRGPLASFHKFGRSRTRSESFEACSADASVRQSARQYTDLRLQLQEKPSPKLIISHMFIFSGLVWSLSLGSLSISLNSKNAAKRVCTSGANPGNCKAATSKAAPPFHFLVP